MSNVLKKIKILGIQEIENALRNLGEYGESIFPAFGSDGIDLDYGIQTKDDYIWLETKYRTKKDQKRIFVRLKLDVVIEGEECE